MRTHHHEVVIVGPAATGARIEARRLSRLLALLQQATEQSLRMRIEGTSAPSGPKPRWLERASAFEFVGIRSGSTVLEFESKSLQDADPSQFAQLSLIPDAPDGKWSPLDVLAASAEEAFIGRGESSHLDKKLLDSFVEFQEILPSADDRFDLRSTKGPLRRVRFDRERIQVARSLSRQTPPTQQIRLSGRLDAIQASDYAFKLRLSDGSVVRGYAAQGPAKQLRDLWDHDVLVSGVGVYGPSGQLIRIEAKTLTAADDTSELWSSIPRQVNFELREKDMHRISGPRSGMKAIYGQWPGTESEDDLIGAMQDP